MAFERVWLECFQDTELFHEDERLDATTKASEVEIQESRYVSRPRAPENKSGRTFLPHHLVDEVHPIGIRVSSWICRLMKSATLMPRDFLFRYLWYSRCYQDHFFLGFKGFWKRDRRRSEALAIGAIWLTLCLQTQNCDFEKVASLSDLFVIYKGQAISKV